MQPKRPHLRSSHAAHRRSRRKMQQSVSPLIQRWILRMLVPLAGYKAFIRPDGFFTDEDVAAAVGLGHWLELDEKSADDSAGGNSFNVRDIYTELHQLHTRHSKAGDVRAEEPLASNAAGLAKTLGLSKVETQLLVFMGLIHNSAVLDSAADMLGRLSTKQMHQTLAVILDISESQISRALSPDELLHKSGLLRVDHDSSQLRNKIDPLSSTFCDQMVGVAAKPIELLGNTLTPGLRPKLRRGDYDHLQEELDTLIAILRSAVKERQRGVNIYLYGPPGTGKTQLARLLPRLLNQPLFEITGEDDEDRRPKGRYPHSSSRSDRLRAYNLAQHLLAKKHRCLLLFDEAEELFSDRNMFEPSIARSQKANTNNILEDNIVPAIWVSNQPLDRVDAAFIRRFSMILEMPVPPLDKRCKIIKRRCRGLLPAADINRLAQVPDLAPAIVEKAATVARNIEGEMGQPASLRAFYRHIDKALELQGHKSLKRYATEDLPEVYDPSIINADQDAVKIGQGLITARCGRLCLYGPPGTGKTAYGRWLAKQLNMRLMVRRASDLLDCYVGKTEQRIAQAFAAAERENALLLIDEMDSFLQDRREARQSWEVSHVNEMLTQIETFSGVFIASTNLVGHLDQAALRRFDLKMKFGYLRPAQAWQLFNRHCRNLSLAECAALKPELARIANLTPGDFAAVVRRHRFHPLNSAQNLLRALVQECDLKEGNARPVGF